MTKTETQVVTTEIIRRPWSAAKLEEFLDHPDQSLGITIREAHLVKYKLDTAFELTTRPSEVHELTQESFHALYDPSLPTIGIDTATSFQGAEIVAFAARQRQEQGLPTCNVVILPTSTQCSYFEEYSHGQGRLVATTGILIDQEGEVHYGPLPTPIAIDALETTQLTIVDRCQALQISTLNSADLMRNASNKNLLHETAASLGVPSPARWQPEEIAGPHGPAEYVIKPAELSGGLGVRFFTQQEKDEALHYYAMLETYNYAPILETRARSWPLYFEEDGHKVRYDWNARVLVAYGECIGMYIRAAKWGEAVNRCNGARAILIDDLANYFPAVEVAAITERLTASAELLARHLETGITGADIIITEGGEAQLLECNIGATGGMATITQMQPDSKKLDTASCLVDAWMSRLTAQPVIHEVPQVSYAWSKNTLQLQQGVQASEMTSYLFAELPLEEITARAEKPQQYFSWLLHAHQYAAVLPEAKLREIHTMLFRQFPIETIGNIDMLFPWKGDDKMLQDFLHDQLALWPNHPQLIAGQLFAQISSKNLAHFKATMNAPCPQNAKSHLDRLVYGTLLNAKYPLYLDAEARTEEDPWDIRPLYEAYFFNDYEMTTTDIRHRLSAAESIDERDMLEELLLEIALAEQNIGDAKIYSARIDSRYENAYTVFSVIDRYKPNLVTTPEGMEFLLQYSCQNHQLLNAMCLFTLGRPYLSQKTEYASASVFAVELGNVLGGTTHEIKWFTAFLQQQIYLSAVPHPFLLHPQTSMQHFASLLWHISNQRFAEGLESMEQLKKTLPDFDENYGYDILANGEIPWAAPSNAVATFL